MKLSDYVAALLVKQGVSHVFAVAGGSSLHLIHSIDDTSGIEFVCPLHEQAGAMAADGYSRVTGNIGAAIATSGPGATNLLTGVCCSYYDSIPLVLITGQVATSRSSENLSVRQIGFQETRTIDIFKSVTKYSAKIVDPTRTRWEVEKACHLARSGRPGPVLIDIPDDLQRVDINIEEMEKFTPIEEVARHSIDDEDLDECVNMIKSAERPVVILGSGIRLAKAEEAAMEFLNKLGFPVAPTWAAADLFPASHDALIGTFGTHGTRYANYAVQNADLVLCIGTRVDTKATGSPVSSFARSARKVVVDVDAGELQKFQHFGLEMDLLIQADARDFLEVINSKLDQCSLRDITNWRNKIGDWKQKYPICPLSYYKETELNPYVFVRTLSNECAEGEIIFVDTGCTVVWMLQAFEFKPNQRLFHDWNNTAMGWALPASIGACFGSGGQQVICVVGDGSLQMNAQELATVVHHRLPIKIFLLNNGGYSMIQQTQDQWLDSRYLASSTETDLTFPDVKKVAQAYGYKTFSVKSNRSVLRAIRRTLEHDGPALCNLEINSKHRVTPQVRYGRPNEDQEPLLDREEFLANMLIDPLPESLESQ